jgi:hypothetical protein
MGVSDIRLRLFSGYLGHGDSDQVLKPWFRNFGVCPHCQKKGAPFLLERLNDAGPIISRSDGESFHLVLGDKPISFPAEKSSGRTATMTAGFWYVSEPKARSLWAGESAGTNGLTQTVVVILRTPPKRGPALMRHLELLADTLAEKITQLGRLATFYEFDGKQLHRNPYT